MNDDLPDACMDARLRLDERIAGELDPVARDAIDRHLATCEGCRTARLEQEAFVARLRVSYPPLRTVRPAAAPGVPRGAARRGWAVPARAAAAGVAAGLIGAWGWTESRGRLPALPVGARQETAIASSYRCPSGTVIEVAAATRWEPRQAADARERIWLEEGEILCRIAPGADHEVATPYGTARHLGTEYRIRVTRDRTGEEPMGRGRTMGAAAGGVVIGVLGGAVLFVDADGGETTVRAGEVMRDTAGERARLVSAEEVGRLERELASVRAEERALRAQNDALRAAAEAATTQAAPDAPAGTTPAEILDRVDWTPVTRGLLRWQDLYARGMRTQDWSEMQSPTFFVEMMATCQALESYKAQVGASTDPAALDAFRERFLRAMLEAGGIRATPDETRALAAEMARLDGEEREMHADTALLPAERGVRHRRLQADRARIATGILGAERGAAVVERIGAGGLSLEVNAQSLMHRGFGVGLAPSRWTLTMTTSEPLGTFLPGALRDFLRANWLTQINAMPPHLLPSAQPAREQAIETYVARYVALRTEMVAQYGEESVLQVERDAPEVAGDVHQPIYQRHAELGAQMIREAYHQLRLAGVPDADLSLFENVPAWVVFVVARPAGGE